MNDCILIALTVVGYMVVETVVTLIVLTKMEPVGST